MNHPETCRDCGDKVTDYYTTKLRQDKLPVALVRAGAPIVRCRDCHERAVYLETRGDPGIYGDYISDPHRQPGRMGICG